MSTEKYSTITCPKCGFAKKEEMPTKTCQYFYECTNCHAMLNPKPGDCCVFCSYGSVACPSIQQKQKSEVKNNSVILALAGAIASAFIASLCCIGPLLIISTGIGGAWLSNVTMFSAYRPYFIALALLPIVYAFWKLYIKPQACKIDEPCALPSNLFIQRVIFWVICIGIVVLLTLPLYS